MLLSHFGSQACEGKAGLFLKYIKKTETALDNSLTGGFRNGGKGTQCIIVSPLDFTLSQFSSNLCCLGEGNTATVHGLAHYMV